MRETSPIVLDVLVVGAGPAGLAAAKTLARSGARVGILDRREAPGKKACGGGLTREALLALRDDQMRDGLRLERYESLTVHTPLGTTGLRASDGLPLITTIDRSDFQMARIEELKAAGVAVRLGERLLRVDGHLAHTGQKTIKFGALIGADGAASRVRRHLGLPRGFGVTGWQVVVEKKQIQSSEIDLNGPVVWFDVASLGTGYGWSFPYGDTLRIGLGLVNTEKRDVSQREIFSEWLGKRALDLATLPLQTGTINTCYLGHRFGPIYLAGDAAGLASPVTGEGIAQALISGREVALEILDPTYRSTEIAKLATRHRRTHHALERPGVKHLLTLTPLLFKMPGIQEKTLAHYVF